MMASLVVLSECIASPTMVISPANNLACPLDGTSLERGEQRYVCANGHSFDVARQGYLNLLPVQHKRSREPGDSKAMVEARSRFLNAGVYEPLSERLNALALTHLAPKDAPCVVDAGCGEGYYLDRFSAALEREGRFSRASFIGLDIAKAAIIAATRRSRRITWLVASNRNPPVAPSSVDMLFCMFGFPDYERFRKILKPDGRVILVDAAQDHLLELREIIYPEVRKSPPPSVDRALRAGFELIDNDTVRFQTDELSQPAIGDLLLMTPHLFRATREGKEAAAGVESLRLTVDVLFRVLACR